MATHVGRLHFVQIKEPKGDPRLERFSTGTKEKWQIGVNKLVAELFTHGLELYPSLTMLGMTSEAGATLGLCAWRPKKLEAEMADDSDSISGPAHEPPYVHLIGINESFQGATVNGSEHTVGYELLRVALTAMKEQWVVRDKPASEMPDVWALVDRNNKRSHELFASHGFMVMRKKRGDYRRYRPYGLPIS